MNKYSFKDTFGTYPFTPEKASRAIVDDLLSDLPEQRRKAVSDAIEAWGSDWGNLVSDSCQYDR